MLVTIIITATINHYPKSSCRGTTLSSKSPHSVASGLDQVGRAGALDCPQRRDAVRGSQRGSLGLRFEESDLGLGFGRDCNWIMAGYWSVDCPAKFSETAMPTGFSAVMTICTSCFAVPISDDRSV